MLTNSNAELNQKLTHSITQNTSLIEADHEMDSVNKNLLQTELQDLQKKLQQKCQRESQMMQELAVAQIKIGSSEHSKNVATAERDILAE